MYRNNETVTRKLLTASREHIRSFLYASEAPGYPIPLLGCPESAARNFGNVDVLAPQNLYGLERPVCELLLSLGADNMLVCVMRFHDVYGPHGTWKGGCEKAPLALLRSALVAKTSSATTTMKILGEKQQNHSFLYTNGCVEAILFLLDFPHRGPEKIGSNRAITMDALAELTCKCAGLQPEDVCFDYVRNSGPVSTQAQNSNKEDAKQQIGWSPKMGLGEGMTRTCEWLKGVIEQQVSQLTDGDRIGKLESLRLTQSIQSTSQCLTFAIILPISSQKCHGPAECIRMLAVFAESLKCTTWTEIDQILPSFDIKLYLAIDDSDKFFSGSGINIAEDGHLCAIWRQCARRAWKDGCDYIALMGSGGMLKDQGWMRNIHAEFRRDLPGNASFPYRAFYSYGYL